MRAGKYNNKKTSYKGRMYDSQAEALKAMELDQMIKDGKIASWTPQVKIILNGENGSKICTYVIDFLVTHLDGSLEYIEIKGFKTAAWRIKYKLLVDKLKNDEKARYTVEYV